MPSLSALVRGTGRVRPGIGSAHRSRARLTLTWLILLAFTWQSFLTQTHIHHLSTVALAGHIGLKAPASNSASTPKDKYPANEDPANCPLCQEIISAGYAVVPAAALLVLPSFVTLNFIVFVELTTPFRAPSHIWQGRAPPSA